MGPASYKLLFAWRIDSTCLICISTFRSHSTGDADWRSHGLSCPQMVEIVAFEARRLSSTRFVCPQNAMSVQNNLGRVEDSEWVFFLQCWSLLSRLIAHLLPYHRCLVHAGSWHRVCGKKTSSKLCNSIAQASGPSHAVRRPRQLSVRLGGKLPRALP